MASDHGLSIFYFDKAMLYTNRYVNCEIQAANH